jgi:transcriptional regulator with XRE-family HTH domain
MNVGPVIESARLARGLSRRALARTLRVHLAQITRWETGDTTPSASILPALCGALRLSYDDLLGPTFRDDVGSL